MVDINRILLSDKFEEFEAYLEALATISVRENLPAIIERFREKRPNARIPDGADYGIADRFFFQSLVQFLVWEKLPGLGLNPTILERIFDRFIEENLFIRLSDYAWEINKAIKSFWDSGNLVFYVLGLPYVAQVMRRAVVAINVKDDAGNVNSGSGVILHSNKSGVGLVLTNRHVLEGRTILDLNCDGRLLEKVSDPIFCETADLAKFCVRLEPETPVVILALDAQILDEIVAIGYPRFPTATHQFAMSHRGEINGAVKAMDGCEYTAISCHVSPGNSGGPIFNKYGYCAGLVTQSATAYYSSSKIRNDTYAATYHLAIPVEVLKDFVT